MIWLLTISLSFFIKTKLVRLKQEVHAENGRYLKDGDKLDIMIHIMRNIVT
jgi:hypothetical protein